MATVDEEFLLFLLLACAASAPLYPARFAQQEKLDRGKLDAGLDELRRRGLVQFTEWVKDAGQGYALTDAGRRALSANRVPTARAAASPREAPADDGINAYQRGEIVRLAIFEPARPFACWTLLAINLLVFAYGAVFTWRHNGSVVAYLKGTAVIHEGHTEVDVLGRLGALWPSVTVPEKGAPWPAEPDRLVRFLFLHVGLIHLCMNMYFLATLGGEIESMWGKARFLAIYFVAGITSGCVIILIDRYRHVNTGAAGASGSLFGIFMALLVWYWLNYDHLPANLIQEWSRALTINLVLLIAVNFVPNVSWAGHLGGAIGGALAALLLHVNRFHPSRIIRWLALAGVPMIPAAFFVAVLWQAGWL
jgi:rhomboid protease GluP